MDFGELKVIKAKDYIGENPNGKKYKFDIVEGGSMFTSVHEIFEGMP